MSQQDPELADGHKITFGESVYDADGRLLGRVRGVDEHGFYVSTADGIIALSVEHEASTTAGEKELMWRCWMCGEMGELSNGHPDECPACGAEKEELYFWTED